MTLRLRLMLFTMAVLLPAIVALMWLVALAGSQERATTEQKVGEMVRALSQAVDRELERRKGIVQVLAESPQLQAWDLDSLCRLAKSSLRDAPGPVALRDSQRQYLNTSQVDCKVAPDIKPVLPASRQGGDPELSPLFAGSVTHELMMMLDVPVTARGQVYQLGLAIRPVELQRLLESYRFPPGWTAAIVDRAGVVAARVPDAQRWVGRLAAGNARNAKGIANTPFEQLDGEGSLAGVDASGMPVQVFFSILKRHGVSFFVTVPQRDFEELSRGMLLRMAVLAGLLILLASLFAHWMGNRILQPIEALQRAARDLQSGQSVTAVQTGVPELWAIGTALARASQAIRDSTAVMNRRVTEAVASSEATQRELLQSQKLETVGQLAGGVAHDFNNVLQTLSTALHVLGNLPQQEAGRPVIEAGIRAVQRAARLVRQLLALGRAPAPEPQPTDLRDLLLQMHDLLACTLPPQLRLATDLPADLWPIQADPAQLEVALLNLLFNARDATGGNGLVTISARNEPAGDGDWVLIRVSDTGEGIAPEVMPRIFDPFFTTKADGRGTGLGLAQVRRFAELSQGSVAARSVAGEGATILLRLPRAARPVAKAPLTAAMARLSGPCWVLLVEDDLLVAQVVVPALEGAGFSVLHARSADEALAMLRGGARFDLVFSDVMMPGNVDGVGLARLLAQDWPQLPVVLTSALAGEIADLPDVPVLPKPYSMQVLVNTLLEALAHHGRRSTP